MKIIVTTPLYPPEIAEPGPYTKEVSSKLKDKLELVVLTYANFTDNDQSPKIISVPKNLSTPIRLLKYFLKLLQISKNTELIYSQSGVAASFSSVLAGLINKKPVIFRYSEDEAWERSKRLGLTDKSLEDFLSTPSKNIKIQLIKFLQTFVLKKSKIIISPSNYFKKLLTDFYLIPEEKIKVIYNPAPKEIKLPFESKKIPGQIIVSSEFLNTRELAQIIETVSDLKKELPDIKLKIIGKTERKDYKKQDFIEFLGPVSEAEKQHLLKSSDLHIINTSTKQNPDILFSSFITKTITISPDLEEMNEITKDSVSGFLFKSEDKEDLKNKIKNILTDKEQQTKISKETQNVLEEKFSWTKHLEQLEKIFNEQK